MIGRWREKREQTWWDRWHAEHRWDNLATYNAERSRGIMHTPEWDARMVEEQAAFDAERGHGGDGFPFRLEGAP